MNNSQFRRLVMDTPSTARSNDKGGTAGSNGARPSATPTALGSRMRSNIPMTPRSLASGSGIDFARQLAERDASLNPASAKKFRSSAAPKGTKLGPGYEDRTHLRISAEEDEKASRVKALEEMVKLGQMERATFEALRDEIVGGDIKDVHLVKGLDYKLLERVRRGEDVLAEAGASPKKAPAPAEGPPADDSVDVDEEFEKIEEREVQPVAKQETVKKGEMAPPPLPTAGRKRTRDDILKELKASRQAALEKAEQARQPTLSSRFHKIGGKQATSRIEIDARGREVLITVDADGNVKRKVKKAKPVVPTETNGLLMPDRDAKPLGSDVTVPETQPAPAEKADEDIFEGVGGDYDPLGGEPDNDDTSDESEGDELNEPASSPKKSPSQPPVSDNKKTAADPLPKQASAPKKNYFNEPTPTSSETPSSSANPVVVPFQDPTILAALKKASTLDPLSSSEDRSASAEASSKAAAHRKRLLEAHDRDADDLDMGFGGSRFEDEEDGEGKRVKLSVWGGGGGKEEGGDGKGEGKEKEKRKRGPKKRKGDKNSAADVMKVLERRKGEGK